MTTTELNPCGCGGEAEIVTVCGETCARCVKCGASTNFETRTTEQAITAWNLAHPLAIRVDAIAEMVEYCKTKNLPRPCHDHCPHSELCKAMTYRDEARDAIDIDKLTKLARGE